MAKWIVNTVEDFVEIESDYMTIGSNGVLFASMETGYPKGAWSQGFWLSYHKQEPEDTT